LSFIADKLMKVAEIGPDGRLKKKF
jgi:hypothetical protein